MAGPQRSQRSTDVQPPRPPNAWILYRSDKLRSLPPPPPGAPRRPQADISKQISQMWKNETPDVRAYYERLSDIKKAEHNLRHPGYRFKPIKKADKERMRAEKKAEKERDRAETRRVGMRKGGRADMPQQFTFEARWGPEDSSPSSSPAPASIPYVPDARYSPYPSPHCRVFQPAPTEPSFSPAPMHYEFQAQIPGMFPGFPSQQAQVPHQQELPSPTQQHQPPLSAPQPQQQSSSLSQRDWQQESFNFDDLNGWLAQTPHDSFDDDYLSIPLPQSASGSPTTWSNDPASLQNAFQFSTEQLQATLSPTSDPSTFQLANLDSGNLFSHPGADIEVAVPQSVTFRDLEHLGMFGDFSSLLYAGQEESIAPNQSAPLTPPSGTSPVERSFGLDSTIEFQELTNRPDDSLGGLDAKMRSHSISSPPRRAPSGSPPASTYILTPPPTAPSNITPSPPRSFINHSPQHFANNGSTSPRSSPPRQSSSRYSSSSSSRGTKAPSTPPEPYVPPAGAVNTGSRRVAASWRNTFATEGQPTVTEVWSGL